MATCALLSSTFTITNKLKNLSLNATTCSSASTRNPNLPALRSLSFSSSYSQHVFDKGCLSVRVVSRPIRRSIVCEVAPQRAVDSVEKRARQNEKRRIFNKSRKSEVKTRMKKVLDALDKLRKKRDAQAEEIAPIEKLIAEAYSVIDKAIKVGTLHRNTGANRKSRLARRKRAVMIHHGWYTPAPASTTT